MRKVAATAQEEASWLSDDEEAMEADAPQTAEGSQEMDTGAGAADEAYIGMFLLKYVCPVEECGGTMLPPPTGDLVPADGTKLQHVWAAQGLTVIHLGFASAVTCVMGWLCSMYVPHVTTSGACVHPGCYPQCCVD